MTTTKAPDVLHFRGSITRSLTWLSTLRSDGYPSPRKTRFWLLAQLCQTGLITRRVPTKGFRVRGSFSFPKLSWRKVILVYGPTQWVNTTGSFWYMDRPNDQMMFVLLREDRDHRAGVDEDALSHARSPPCARGWR